MIVHRRIGLLRRYHRDEQQGRWAVPGGYGKTVHRAQMPLAVCSVNADQWGRAIGGHQVERSHKWAQTGAWQRDSCLLPPAPEGEQFAEGAGVLDEPVPGTGYQGRSDGGFVKAFQPEHLIALLAVVLLLLVSDCGGG
ncbi:hypothetical protein [Streptomyces californicus]|uniref:hypothetical protein n=1 Tax=Streptomyces californicus TaxID=67351 RepID=UPI0037241FD4